MPVVTVLKIALPVPMRQQFEYLPCGPLPAAGCRCLVPFGPRKLVGIVVGSGPASGQYKLQRVIQVIDHTPILPPTLLSFCRKAAAYYHQPLGEMLTTALPVLLRQGRSPDDQRPVCWRLTNKGRFVRPEQFKNAHRQRQAWQVLHDKPQGLSLMALRLLEVTPDSLKGLARKGWAEQALLQDIPESRALLGEPPLQPNDEQQAAINQISDCNGYHGFLLNGVTGSGKTEVYLQAAAKVLAAGKQVLVLVPEIGLTPQTLQRFQQRFNRRIDNLHSGLTNPQRLAVWESARQGRSAIVMGTRSALFTPLARPGLIIVDESHDASFRQQEGCRYHARDMALLRGKLEDIPVVLGSATPTLESLHLVQENKLTALPLSTRAASKPPHMHLEDCRSLPGNQLLAPASQQAIHATLKAGQQALVFLNRRGYAPLITCLNCGWQLECPDCNRFMTWHKHANRLVCHHCDRRVFVPKHCAHCDSSRLADVGLGTEKIEEQLQRQFPYHPVIRIDRDVTRRKGSFENKLKHIREGKPAILTGTQMLAKGHHFPNLALTIILDTDAGFMSADFRGAEQAGQLLLQVAGRTGRSEQQGNVIVQTRHPDLPSLQQLMQGDWQAFSRNLLNERQPVGLPPFGYMALLSAESVHQQHPITLLESASSLFSGQSAVSVMGPVPAPMEKRAGRYRFQLLLLSSQRPALHQMLSRVLPALEKKPEARRCRWAIDVDPINML